MRRFMRETAFNLARRDLAMFLSEHEQDLVLVLREELQRLDDEIHEEGLFIDIRMVPLGEVVLQAALRAITRFLNGDVPAAQLPAETSE